MRKQPERTCMGCNEKKPKKEFIRIVKNKDNEINIDRTGKMQGRGAYICDNIQCLEKLIKSKRLEKVFDIKISDEIYEKLIYDNKEIVSIASLSEDSYNRTIVINGLSKSYAMTGWRIGYSASSVEIAKLMSSIQSHVTSNINSISRMNLVVFNYMKKSLIILVVSI